MIIHTSTVFDNSSSMIDGEFVIIPPLIRKRRMWQKVTTIMKKNPQ